MFEVRRFFVRTEQTQCLSELSADSSEEPTCRPTLIHYTSYTGIFRKIYSTVFFFKLVMEDKVSIIYKSVYTFKMPKTFLNTGFSIFFLLMDAGIFISLCTFFIYSKMFVQCVQFYNHKSLSLRTTKH